MKVAILHVTRTKLGTSEHAKLTSETQHMIEHYVEDHLPTKVQGVDIRNFFINTGFTWSQMKDVIEEINQKKFDGFLLYMAPEAAKLSLFNKNFLDFTHQHFKKTPICNLIATNGYISFFLRGINPCSYGTKVFSKEAVTA